MTSALRRPAIVGTKNVALEGGRRVTGMCEAGMPNQAHRDVFTAFPGTRLPSSGKRPDWHKALEERHPTSGKRPDWHKALEERQPTSGKRPACHNALEERQLTFGKRPAWHNALEERQPTSSKRPAWHNAQKKRHHPPASSKTGTALESSM